MNVKQSRVSPYSPRSPEIREPISIHEDGIKYYLGFVEDVIVDTARNACTFGLAQVNNRASDFSVTVCYGGGAPNKFDKVFVKGDLVVGDNNRYKIVNASFVVKEAFTPKETILGETIRNQQLLIDELNARVATLESDLKRALGQ